MIAQLSARVKNVYHGKNPNTGLPSEYAYVGLQEITPDERVNDFNFRCSPLLADVFRQSTGKTTFKIEFEGQLYGKNMTLTAVNVERVAAPAPVK